MEREIGALTVTASLDAICREVAESAVSILISNGLKTFLVTIFMMFLFRRMVTGRLETLARKAGELIPRI